MLCQLLQAEAGREKESANVVTPLLLLLSPMLLFLHVSQGKRVEGRGLDDEDMAESEPLPTREAAEAELRDFIGSCHPMNTRGLSCRTPAGPGSVSVSVRGHRMRNCRVGNLQI